MGEYSITMQTKSDKSTVRDDEALNNAPEKESAFIKCESCGGNMVFDPETQKLKCAHCGRTDSFANNDCVLELDIKQAFEKSEKWNDEVSVYRCSNCGAVFNLRADIVSVKCPYCSTTHIVKSDDLAGVKPNAVYPFLLTEQKAVELSRKWIKRKIFAPSAFKKSLEAKNVNGVYLPCFTFDSQTQSFYEGRLGERKTRTVKTSNGTRTETYIKWHHVRGVFNRFFDDITISSGKTSQSEMDKLLPCVNNSIRVYEKGYLSGYTAGHYTRDVKACWKDARSIIDAKLRTAILASYGYDVIDYLNVSTVHSGVTYKYVLFPVYKFNYRFKKKDYGLTVNGNSGKIIGKTPVSPLRVFIAVVIALAIICGIIFASDCTVVRPRAFNQEQNVCEYLSTVCENLSQTIN